MEATFLQQAHQSPVTDVLDVKSGAEVRTEALSDSASETSTDETVAAHVGTRPGDLEPTVDLTASHLIASPYSDLANQLILQPLDPQSRLFAFALTTITPTTTSYATASYTDAFNWPTVFTTLRALCDQQGIQWRRQKFYVVIFRSKLREWADTVRLGELDQKSHEEACASGGLLKYWFGSVDAERRNLATCLWVSRKDAAAGGSGPWHKKARGAVREMYESISFHTHALVIDDDVTSWELEDFSG